MEQSAGLFKGNNGEALRFFERALKNNFLSEKHGRPIFDTGLFVEIITPGSNASVPEKMVERTLSEEAGLDGKKRKVQRTPDYDRYKAQVEAYKNNRGEGEIDGMPLSQWPQVDAGTAASLKAVGVHTVEQLAEVMDAHLPNLGTGGRYLREQAKAYITARQFGIPIAQQTAEVENLKAELKRVEQERDEALKALKDATTKKVAKAEKVTDAPPPAPADGEGVI